MRSKLDKFFDNLPPINKRRKIALDMDRKEAIYRILKDWAYKIKGYYLISFWDLADGLNNLWYAHLFVNKYLHKDKIVKYHNKWALSKDNVYVFRRNLNNAVKKLGGKVIKKGYNTYYKINLTT